MPFKQLWNLLSAGVLEPRSSADTKGLSSGSVRSYMEFFTAQSSASPVHALFKCQLYFHYLLLKPYLLRDLWIALFFPSHIF